MHKKRLEIYLNIFLLFILFIFLFLYISPFGTASFKKDFSKKYNNIFLGKGAIYKLNPHDRIIDKNKLISEPAYFYLKTPRNFDKAELEIKYKISEQIQEQENNFLDFKIGVLLNKNNWNYQLYPLYNNILDIAIDNWHIQESKDTIFLQKEKNFSSLDDFISNNNFSDLALYNYNLENNYIIENYISDKNYFIELPALLGSHIFYVYLKDQNLKFDFSFVNINQENQDNLDIFVYSDSDILFSKSFSPKDFSDNQKVDFNLDLAGFPEGVYKVEIRANDSFVIEKFVSYLEKFSFLRKINLYNTSSGFEIYSNKSNFRIKVLDAKCLDEISINNQNFTLDRIFQQFSFDIKQEDVNIIKSDSCGVLIENSGLIAVDERSLFNPLISQIELSDDLDNYNYLITNYQKADKKGDYYISKTEIDLSKAYREKGDYSFVLSAGFLDGSDKNKYLEIKEIKIKLYGKNLWQKFLEILSKK